MPSLTKIPMVVLFGLTSLEKFAPDYNAEIFLDSKKIKNLNDIDSINVEDVLRELKLHSERELLPAAIGACRLRYCRP